MRSIRRAGLISGILLLLAARLLGQPSPVSVSLVPNGPTVGDHVEATVTLRVAAADLAGEPRFPPWGKSWGEAEIVGEGKPARVSAGQGLAVYEQRLVLAAFRPGAVPLPPAGIVLPLRTGTVNVRTPGGLALNVRSVIPQSDQDPQPKPPAALRSLPVGERFWWTLAILTAACLAAVWLLWRRHRRTQAERAAEAPPLAPFEELAADLDRLLHEPSMVAFHTRLSFVLRRYLGRRLPFPAVESTTSDIQRQLLSRRLPGSLVRPTVELLRACDLVKFARQAVGEAQARERLQTVRRIAGELESYLAPRQPERLEAAG